jgi:hypothetical protein
MIKVIANSIFLSITMFFVFLFQMKQFAVVGGSTPRLMLLLGKFEVFFNIYLFLPCVRCKYNVPRYE